jgi:hypothetical protein
MQQVLRKRVEPFRVEEREGVLESLDKQGGLDRCSIAFYGVDDLGDDAEWDNWRLEGPAFVWYFSGSPHVHVWVNVANDPAVTITSRNGVYLNPDHDSHYRGGPLRHTPAVDDVRQTWSPVLAYVQGLARAYGLLKGSLSPEGRMWLENQTYLLGEITSHLERQEQILLAQSIESANVARRQDAHTNNLVEQLTQQLAERIHEESGERGHGPSAAPRSRRCGSARSCGAASGASVEPRQSAKPIMHRWFLALQAT